MLIKNDADMKNFTFVFLMLSIPVLAQVGIGNTDPKANLDISASTPSNPANTDGILIPRIDSFPTTNPTAAQQGMMVYLTTTSGSNTPGFYYWDNTSTSWIAVGNNVIDDDWYVQGSLNTPTSINDNIYTQGNVSIGDAAVSTTKLYVISDASSNNYGLRNVQTGSNPGSISYGFYNQSNISNVIRNYAIYNLIQGINNGDNYGINNNFFNTGTGIKYGVYNDFDYSAPQGGKYGVWNRFEGGDSFVTGIKNEAPGAWAITGTLTGIENSLNATGNGVRYGTRTTITGSGTGAKYGSYNSIDAAAGGTHYGVYSNVLKPSGYAGYFLGRVSIGTTTTNNYIFPASRGANGQIITTDGSGNLSWVTPTDNDNQQVNLFSLTGTTLGISLQNDGIPPVTVDLSPLQDTDWTTVGADIKRQSGNVYIGNTSATNNNLYISNQIIDWDNSNYYIDPNSTSKVNEIEFDTGSATDPSIRFVDTDTGFFSPSLSTTAYSANGSEAFRVQSDGEISIGLTTPTSYNLSINSLSNLSEIRLGNTNFNDDVMLINHGGDRKNGLQVNVTSSYTLASRSGISVNNSYSGVITNIGKYSTASSVFGIENSISGNRTYNVYGVYNLISNTGTGIHYGTQNRLTGTGLGTKYGTYNFIPTTAGGTHYGVYANVLKTGSYAGYFLGNVSIGTTSTNNYIFPASRGANGQIITTDGSGNLSWVTPTDNDNQQVNLFSLTGTTLEISLQNDGVSPATVDLSPLQDSDWYETGGTPPNNINDNIYTLGNVSIGTSSNTFRLDVTDNQDSNYIAQFENSSTHIDADGIKISLAATSLTTSNNFIGFYRGAGLVNGKIVGNGTGVLYQTTSDRRLKTNILSIENALQLIRKIQPRKYEYKANRGVKEYGFIAQELQQVYPQAVSGDPNGNVETNPMMVDYSRLTPILTAGIKELNQKVETLEKENQELKEQLKKYENLEKRLTNLEKLTSKISSVNAN